MKLKIKMSHLAMILILVCVSILAISLGVRYYLDAKRDAMSMENGDKLDIEHYKNPDAMQHVNQWKFYFQEVNHADCMAQFEKAHQIVLQSQHVEGSMEDASERFNQWFVLRYPEQKLKHFQVFDKSRANKPVYIVDLDKGKIVVRNDLQAILSIYQQLLRDIHLHPTKQERYIKRMAILTSIVVFGHERYDEPQLEFMPDNTEMATLRYVIKPIDGSIIDLQCELVIHKDTIKWRVFEQHQI